MRLILIFFLFSFEFVAAQTRTIHVVVALCDNVNQGIVPVPKSLGNGQDAKNNLYWGAGFGVKTFFKNSKEWTLVKTIANPKEHILERILFKHKTSNTYLLADAYDGAKIKNTTVDFLDFSAGNKPEKINLDSISLEFGGKSNLLVYIGHDGLMDFRLETTPKKANDKKRETIILACASKNYFAEHLRVTGAYPLLWTTNLMCPEAYTLKAAVEGWIKNETNEQIRERAAATYHEYQKCGLKGARNLLVTGW
jgi:hypothetical protein